MELKELGVLVEECRNELESCCLILTFMTSYLAENHPLKIMLSEVTKIGQKFEVIQLEAVEQEKNAQDCKTALAQQISTINELLSSVNRKIC